MNHYSVVSPWIVGGGFVCHGRNEGMMLLRGGVARPVSPTFSPNSKPRYKCGVHLPSIHPSDGGCVSEPSFSQPSDAWWERHQARSMESWSVQPTSIHPTYPSHLSIPSHPTCLVISSSDRCRKQWFTDLSLPVAISRIQICRSALHTPSDPGG